MQSKYTASLLGIAVVAGLFSGALVAPALQQSNAGLSQGINYSASVKWEAFHPIYDESGAIVGYEKFHEEEKHNLLTNEGKEFIELEVGNAGTTDEVQYVAMSNGGTTPAAGDTTCESEITANGLARAIGAYASTGTGVWTISKTFTASGSQSAQKSCLFTDVTNGEPDTMFAEALMTSVSLATNDQVTVTWTITVS